MKIMGKGRALVTAFALGAGIASAAVVDDTRSAIAEIDAFAARGMHAEACKAIGDTANEFQDLSISASAAHEALMGELDVRYKTNNCAETVKSILPTETSVNRNDTIRWWEALSEAERAEFKKAGKGDVQAVRGWVVSIVTATIQTNDREGDGRRAERERGLRERDAANREVAREARERDHARIARPIDSAVTRATDMDY